SRALGFARSESAHRANHPDDHAQSGGGRLRAFHPDHARRQDLQPRLDVIRVNPLLTQAAAFAKAIEKAKRGLRPDFEWYPYDTMSALWHVDKLLSPPHRELLA